MIGQKSTWVNKDAVPGHQHKVAKTGDWLVYPPDGAEAYVADAAYFKTTYTPMPGFDGSFVKVVPVFAAVLLRPMHIGHEQQGATKGEVGDFVIFGDHGAYIVDKKTFAAQSDNLPFNKQYVTERVCPGLLCMQYRPCGVHNFAPCLTMRILVATLVRHDDVAPRVVRERELTVPPRLSGLARPQQGPHHCCCHWVYRYALIDDDSGHPTEPMQLPAATSATKVMAEDASKSVSHWAHGTIVRDNKTTDVFVNDSRDGSIKHFRKGKLVWRRTAVKNDSNGVRSAHRKMIEVRYPYDDITAVNKLPTPDEYAKALDATPGLREAKERYSVCQRSPSASPFHPQECARRAGLLRTASFFTLQPTTVDCQFRLSIKAPSNTFVCLVSRLPCPVSTIKRAMGIASTATINTAERQALRAHIASTLYDELVARYRPLQGRELNVVVGPPGAGDASPRLHARENTRALLLPDPMYKRVTCVIQMNAFYRLLLPNE